VPESQIKRWSTIAQQLFDGDDDEEE